MPWRHLRDKKIELAEAKKANVPYMEDLASKMEEEIASGESLAAEKLANIPYVEQYLAELQNVADAQDDFIAARMDLLSKLNEKAIEQQNYVEAIQAWILVKQAIAEVKEQISTDKETQADRRITIIESKKEFQTAQLMLAEAERRLQSLKITGRSELLIQQAKNLPILLETKLGAMDNKVEYESALVDSQISFEMWEAEQKFLNEENIYDFIWPKEERSIERVALAQINKEGKLAEISANTKLTSQLTHVLT